MGVSLSGVEAWSASDELQPGPYLVQSVKDSVERKESSGGNPQIEVDWRVLAGDFKGAEKRDWITITEASVGRVVQVIQACGHQVPDEDFDSYAALADWVAAMLRKEPKTEIVVREDSWVGTDRETGQAVQRTGMKIKGYRAPSTGSDLSSDTSGFTSGSPVSDDDVPF